MKTSQSDPIAIHQQRRREILGLSLMEVMLLLVFVFLIVVESVVSDLHAKSAEVEILEQDRGELQAYREEMDIILKRYRYSIDDLRKPDNPFSRLVDLNRLTREQKRQLDILADAEARARSHRQALERKQSELDSAGEDKKGLTREVARLERRIEQDKAKIDKLEKDASASADAQVKARDNMIRRLRQELRLAETKIQEFEASASDRLKAANKKVRELTRERDRLAKDLRKAREELAAGKTNDPKGRRGPSWPACWRQDDERDYALTILMFENDYVLQRAWPTERQREMTAFGVTQNLIGKAWSQRSFKRMAQRMYDDGIRRGCRHWVFVIDRTSSKGGYKARLKEVGRFYYFREID